jgi:hypothetical protein
MLKAVGINDTYTWMKSNASQVTEISNVVIPNYDFWIRGILWLHFYDSAFMQNCQLIKSFPAVVKNLKTETDAR